VDKCLDRDPEKRPTIEYLLRYPLIRSELDNIMEYLLPLTHDHTTAVRGHLLLEQVVEI
jgi:hypothetical protein